MNQLLLPTQRYNPKPVKMNKLQLLIFLLQHKTNKLIVDNVQMQIILKMNLHLSALMPLMIKVLQNTAGYFTHFADSTSSCVSRPRLTWANSPSFFQVP